MLLSPSPLTRVLPLGMMKGLGLSDPSLETNIPFCLLIIGTLQRVIPPQLGEVLNLLPLVSCNQVDLDLEARATNRASLQPPRRLPPRPVELKNYGMTT